MNDSLIDFYLSKIAALQSTGNGYFDEGLFPAYRVNKSIGYKRPDTTLFFTAITVFTLQKIKTKLAHNQQKLIDEMTIKAQAAYPLFQNKDGLATYNFWKTRPSKHFPNGYIFKHFDHFRIPDDIDDTAFVYLTTTRTSEDWTWLKQKLAQHSNLTKQQIRNTYSEYKPLRAYATWFGKNMYIEFDVCVLSNILYAIFESKQPINQHDSDSLAYIKSVIETDRYLHNPFSVAHQYPRTPLIIYHIVRLICAFDIEVLKPLCPKIIADTQRILTTTTSKMDTVILGTSLMRLGIKPERLISEINEADFDEFYFFIAGLLTAYELPWLYKWASKPIFHISWQCKAHCYALLTEYEVLRATM
jgi:hypothetical protein